MQKETTEGDALIAEAKEIYAYQKAHWSKPVDEDYVTNHLGYIHEDIFCGINKRIIGIYNIGFSPVQYIETSSEHICKACYRIWKSRHNSLNSK